MVHFFYKGKNVHRTDMKHIPRIGDTIDLADLEDEPDKGIIGTVEDVWWNPIKDVDTIYIYLIDKKQ